MISLPENGLYLITPPRHPDLARLEDEVRAALDGGVAVLQFRDKSQDQQWRLSAARRLRVLCHAAGVPLIVNDDIELARASGADGVHIGREDGELAAVREAAGPGLVLGVSCYDDLGRAAKAVESGADYLAFGSVYPSSTKPDAVHCPLPTLAVARSLGRPVVAIGGITPENGAPVIAAGADFLAVIDGVFGDADISLAARRLSGLWPQSHPGTPG
jgi:thiamine-phosphate pyrophosphorylase